MVEGSRHFENSVTDSAVDANTNAVGTALKMGGATQVGLYIIDGSDGHTNHIVTIQISPNGGTNWFDTAHTITGLGELHDVTCIADEIRAKVTTVEGGVSVIEIVLIIK